MRLSITNLDLQQEVNPPVADWGAFASSGAILMWIKQNLQIQWENSGKKRQFWFAVQPLTCWNPWKQNNLPILSPYAPPYLHHDWTMVKPFTKLFDFPLSISHKNKRRWQWQGSGSEDLVTMSTKVISKAKKIFSRWVGPNQWSVFRSYNSGYHVSPK